MAAVVGSSSAAVSDAALSAFRVVDEGNMMRRNASAVGPRPRGTRSRERTRRRAIGLLDQASVGAVAPEASPSSTAREKR